MRIQFLRGSSSIHGVFNVKAVVDLPDEVAQRFLDTGAAIKAKPAKIPAGMFWCDKCRSLHKLTSPIGIEHHKYLK